MRQNTDGFVSVIVLEIFMLGIFNAPSGDFVWVSKYVGISYTTGKIMYVICVHFLYKHI